MSNLKIELDPREDKKDRIFYLGKITAPIYLDCRKGVAFLIFVAEEGEEELQIALLDQDFQNLNSCLIKEDRLKISLSVRKDKWKKTFYVGKIQADVILNGEEGLSFLVFLSRQGLEELQIVGKLTQV